VSLRRAARAVFDAALQAADVHPLVRRALADVRATLIEGAALTVAIVFLFLASWRSTVITGLTLPVALIGTFLFVYLLGFTLNSLTLMALSLSVGLLIDDAIVVRENIVRHLGMGKDHHRAARDDGTEEREEVALHLPVRTHQRHLLALLVHHPGAAPLRVHHHRRPGEAGRLGLVAQRARERAADVAEQMALDEVLRDRAAVDRDEPARAPRHRVQPARQHLLAGAGLAEEQDRRLGPADPIEDREARGELGRAGAGGTGPGRRRRA